MSSGGAKILENEVRSGVKALPKAGARIESEAAIGARRSIPTAV